MRARFRRLKAWPLAAWQLLGGILFLVLIGFAPSFYGTLTASSRLDDAVARASAGGGNIDVVVVLGSSPQPFHMRELQRIATIGRVTDLGGSSKILLRRVSRANLSTLAAQPWILKIEPP